MDKYPIPRIEDLYTTLAGGEKFTKLDLGNAYLQMQLDEHSRKYVTINTQRLVHIQYLTVLAKFSVGHIPARYRQSDQEHTKHNGVPRRHSRYWIDRS